MRRLTQPAGWLCAALWAGQAFSQAEQTAADGAANQKRDANALSGAVDLSFDAPPGEDAENKTTEPAALSGEVDLTPDAPADGAPSDQPAQSDLFSVQKTAQSFWDAQIFAPMRVTLAQEAAYKVEKPDYLVKNRSSLRVEYSKDFLDHFFVQLDAKSTLFLSQDHRHDGEGSDTMVSQAYVQSSFYRTSVNVGVQTVAWGESILAPITDEVSPRDNRELFNFNLEELRIGQPMVTLDQYSNFGRWSFFFNPDPTFNKNPQRGSAYYVNPFGNARVIREPNDGGKSEYGVNWRRTFGSADVSVMAASLIDNDYAVRRDELGRIVQEKERLSLAGMTFSYALKKFLVKGEMGVKSPKAFNDASLQIVKRDSVDTYVGVEYRSSPTLSVSVEGVNQHIVDWNNEIQTARDRQSLLLSVTKRMMNDDLTINTLNFFNRPNDSMLTMLLTTYKWNDNLTLGLNVIYPYTRSEGSGLWNVRDQKQLTFKVQYQF